jgi:hypothetical protein
MRIKPGKQRLTIEAKLAALSEFWEFLPGLVDGYPAEFATVEERAAFDAEMARQAAVKNAQMDVVLRERLATFHESLWAEIFSHRPEWEHELTPEQAARWAAHLEEAKRSRLRATQSNIVNFPGKE